MTKADTTQAADKAIATWAAAWAESSTESVQRMLVQVWAEDGQYTDSNTVLKGRAEVADYIVKFQQRLPGARFVYSKPNMHHGFLRFAWQLLLMDGTIRNEGMDFAELGPDGRFRTIVGFFGPPPSAK
jgi:SnoaL-like domain